MVSTIPTAKENVNPKSNEYHVGGIKVEFPYHPYGPQLAFMGRVISTLERAQREGHCHALLESPTGTGKSLSLLCSTLAWQQHQMAKNKRASAVFSKPDTEALLDPLGHGGGFIPETLCSGISSSNNSDPTQPVVSKNSKKKMVAPTILYASRTHSQISQVIHEYKKTTYRVPMAVLASRKHYCTNQKVNKLENIDEECKLLLRNGGGCIQFNNANKVRGHPSLQKGGCHEVHDIEDLMNVGEVVKGCAYYAARNMADDAQLIFCPYSYIISPIIRGAMDVDIRGAIVILDEAHNIEDVARDAGSVDIDEDGLLKLRLELEQLCTTDAMTYQPLYEMTQDLIHWVDRKTGSLGKHDFQHYFSCWTGDDALREFKEANISPQCFPILLDCATKAIQVATDAESDMPHLSGMSVIILEGFFSSLTYMFSRNGCHVSDYQFALQRYIKRENFGGAWTYTVSLWCLNPAVVFRDITDLSLSVILTSGTLSPMNSFSSELGVHFGTYLEAPHIIDVESQLWATVLPSGFDRRPLNASYKMADGYAFQDSLGKSLEEICKVVPAGSLVFFPSYKLMEKLCNRWHETGQWDQLNATKTLFVEPRGSQEDFDFVLKSYYDSICGIGQAVGKKKRTRRLGLNGSKTPWCHQNSNKDGAAFLAVCRGKVSEGINFSDDNARVVIVVGIPFPNINDIQIGLKKKYNDTYKASKKLLSGSEWYCHQAFRAINQAIGRSIRHQFDYGAVILLDERYLEERNRMYISKWVRKSIRQYESFDVALEGLRCFFRDAKEHVARDDDASSHLPQSCHAGNRKKKPEDDDDGDDPPDKFAADLALLIKHNVSALQSNPQEGDEVAQASVAIDDSDGGDEVFEIKDDHTKEPRSSVASSHEDPEGTIVKETPHRILPWSFCSSSVTDDAIAVSVNSGTKKRRNSIYSTSVGFPRSDINGGRIEFDLDGDNCSDTADKQVQIRCVFCKCHLGLSENHYAVTGTLAVSSKSHLISLLRERSDHSDENKPTSVPVLKADVCLLDPNLCNRGVKGAPGQGVWCEEDGCVFSSIFCPSCRGFNCVGAQIMAADASNIDLLNKAVLFVDRLEVYHLRPSRPPLTKKVQAHSPELHAADHFDSIDGCSSPPASAVRIAPNSKFRTFVL